MKRKRKKSDIEQDHISRLIFKNFIHFMVVIMYIKLFLKFRLNYIYTHICICQKFLCMWNSNTHRWVYFQTLILRSSVDIKSMSKTFLIRCHGYRVICKYDPWPHRVHIYLYIQSEIPVYSVTPIRTNHVTSMQIKSWTNFFDRDINRGEVHRWSSNICNTRAITTDITLVLQCYRYA